MRCSQPDFVDYCNGSKEPSPEEFHRLVNVIVHEQGKLIAQNRDLLSKIRSRDNRT
jgi:hypothetical protein